jgi:transcriptional regulator with XRE-family HTH domain
MAIVFGRTLILAKIFSQPLCAMSIVSNNIKYLRKLNGLTQEQFSRRIGIKRSLLGAYEEARANPNHNNLIAMAKAFNVSVDMLLKQDLQRIRQTPELSIPLGNAPLIQNGLPANPPAVAPIFQTTGEPDSPDQFMSATDAPIVGTAYDDPFADTPDDPFGPVVSAKGSSGASGGSRPGPQPLSSVLNKYYRTESPAQPRPQQQPPARPPVVVTPASVPPAVAPVTMPVAQPMPPITAPVMPLPVAHAVPVPLPQPTQMPAPARSSEESSVHPAIPYVQQFQLAEYQQRHLQPDYLSRLPTMRLPNLPAGHYRAFEADADFTFPGALLVGQFVRNWFEIAEGRRYVLLVQNAGVFCRRVVNQVQQNGTLLLMADRPSVPSREVALKDVLEVWEVRAFVSQLMPDATPNFDRIKQLTDELRYEVERLK